MQPVSGAGDQPRLQVISAPQQSGDLIFPCPFGHLEICTVEPSSRVKTSFSSGASQAPHVALTVIPQEEHSYVCMALLMYEFGVEIR